jgi:sulfate adenylyltransferase subunit 2
MLLMSLSLMALEAVGMKKSKSKRTHFSVRDDFGQWDEKNQRPELFDILNGKIENGQNVRVFQFQMDRTRCVELYRRGTNRNSIYLFSHKRKVLERRNDLVTLSFCLPRRKKKLKTNCSFRTVGDMSCTAAVDSYAATIKEVVGEIRLSTISERGARMTNVQRQRWRKENNKGTFRMKSFKIILAVFLLVLV